jgi:hypothetical protein
VAGAAPPWRTTQVGFTDYDLVGGPAGVVLAQLMGSVAVRADRLAPPAAHLVALAGNPAGFRIGAHAGHPLVGWTQGGVVTGLAHGVAGPLAALSLAARHASGVTDTVHRLAAWLADQRYTGGDGIVSWPHRAPVGERGPVQLELPVGQNRRQGWCYGTPGIAWALWTAGRALVHSRYDSQPSCRLALEAMASLCAGYDPDRHLDDGPLAVCHGAAGVLLVADAFARHAALAPAAALRARLLGLLTDRLDEAVRLDDTSLLSGSAGVLAAMLTATGGDRAWLRCLALY